MIARVSRLSLVLMLAGGSACSDVDTRYYRDRVNSVTTDNMAMRYGPPHKIEKFDKGKKVWTYYERGSGTASYSGLATGGYCHAFVLTFDQEDILRDWQQIQCSN